MQHMLEHNSGYMPTVEESKQVRPSMEESNVAFIKHVLVQSMFSDVLNYTYNYFALHHCNCLSSDNV